jgi:hypothetical protein
MRNNKIDRAVALILFILGSMQFFEYILWINQDCNLTNKIVSMMIPVYLYFQPAAFALVAWQMKAGWGTLYPFIIGVTLLTGIPYFAYYYNNKVPCIKKGECNHLDWNLKINLFDKKNTYIELFGILFYYFSLFYVGGTLKNTTLSAIFVILLASSWIITNKLYNEVWASVWCHSVNATALAALFV